MQSNTAGATALAAQSGLSPSEIERGNMYLQQTQIGVIGAIKGLSEAQWNFHMPTPAWSIAEIMEHVTFVQERVLGMLRDHLPAAPEGPAERNYALVDAIIINQFPNRLAKFPVPEFAIPKGGVTLSEALERVVSNTRRLAESLEATPDLRRHLLESPPLKAVTKSEYGVMDGYQWILAATAHAERHTKQILEVRADPKFPSE
jgi:DinB family protein